PVDILSHILVGSEGTLGFVAEAVFRTVELKTHAATAFLLFPSLRAATEALPALVASEAAAIELMDAASLRVAQQGDPAGGIDALEIHDHAALLIEYQESTPQALAQRVAAAQDLLAT